MNLTEETRRDIKVLLVDDTKLILAVHQALLRQLNFKKIKTANNGEDAYKLIQFGSFDLVLCDWNMPGMSGLDLLKEIRSHHATQDLPFIMISGESEQVAVEQAKQAGASGFIPKPFQPEELLDEISQVLSCKVY